MSLSRRGRCQVHSVRGASVARRLLHLQQVPRSVVRTWVSDGRRRHPVSKLLQRGLVNNLLLMLITTMMMMIFYEHQEANDDDDHLEEESSQSRDLESEVQVKSGCTQLEAPVQCGNGA